MSFGSHKGGKGKLRSAHICHHDIYRLGRPGCTPGEMAEKLEAAGVEAIGINCSLGPEESYPIMKELSSLSRLLS